MTSWKTIKEHFTEKNEFKTNMYYSQIIKAATLAIKLMTNLNDSHITKADMNTDDELKEALLISKN